MDEKNRETEEFMVCDTLLFKAIFLLVILVGLLVGCEEATDESDSPASPSRQDLDKTAEESDDNWDYCEIEDHGRLEATIPLNLDTSPAELRAVLKRGDIERIKDLLNAGLDINSIDLGGGATLLERAAVEDHVAVVELLLFRGADPDAQSDYGTAPLHAACWYGNEKVVKLLIDNRADVRLPDKDGETPLHVAASSNNLNIARMLLANGADSSAETSGGSTPLDVAASHGKKDMFEFLKMAGARSRNRIGAEFILAVETGDMERVVELLDRGASVDLEDALIRAAQNGSKELVVFLLMKGADAHNGSCWDVSPLYVAVRFGHTEVAGILLNWGADVNWQSWSVLKKTALHEAVEAGNTEMVMLLLDAEADPNLLEFRGWTPLHLAVARGNVETAGLLLQQGADAAAMNRDGNTPFDFADTEEMKKLLIAHGAVSGAEK